MNCDGCKSLIHWSHRDHECAYTTTGFLDIIECPCKECLLKVMCKDTCQKFNEVFNNPQNSNRVIRTKQIFLNSMKRVKP